MEAIREYAAMEYDFNSFQQMIGSYIERKVGNNEFLSWNIENNLPKIKLHRELTDGEEHKIKKHFGSYALDQNDLLFHVLCHFYQTDYDSLTYQMKQQNHDDFVLLLFEK